MKHRRCPSCGRFSWRVPGWSWKLWSWTRWNCPRCGVLLQANLVRTKVSFWIVNIWFIFWVVIGFGLSFSYSVAVVLVGGGLIDFAVNGVQLARRSIPR